MCKVWSKPSLSEQRRVNTRVKEWRYVFVTYMDTNIKCILVSDIVIWLASRRFSSPKMENVENYFKINVSRPVNRPFIQKEMTLLCKSY